MWDGEDETGGRPRPWEWGQHDAEPTVSGEPPPSAERLAGAEPAAAAGLSGRAEVPEPPSYPIAEATAEGFGTPPQRSRSRRGPVVLGFAAIAAVAAVVLALLLPAGQRSAQATVMASVTNAVASKTARATLTFDMNSGQLTGTGAGVLNFSSGAMDIALGMRTPSLPQGLRVRAIYEGGVVFEQIPQLFDLPQFHSLEPGKSWVSLNLSGLVNASGGTGALGSGGNPTAMLRILSQQGNAVVRSGTSVVDGTRVKSYTVTLNPAVLSREAGSATLPSWLRAALQHVTFQNASEVVFIDGSGRLKQFSIHMLIAAPSTPQGSITVDETMDLSDYGVPVSITAPPSSQVLDFQRLLNDLGAVGSSTG
jgi:hypothetical protein